MRLYEGYRDAHPPSPLAHLPSSVASSYVCVVGLWYFWILICDGFVRLFLQECFNLRYLMAVRMVMGKYSVGLPAQATLDQQSVLLDSAVHLCL